MATTPTKAIEAPTDDHPFPYLRTRSIAPFYWQTLLLMLFASILLVGGAGGGMASFRGMRRYVDLARTLGSEVVAEGVESRAELAVLRDLNVEYAQGFLWGQPA